MQVVGFLQRYLQKLHSITDSAVRLPSPVILGYEDVLYRATLLMILPGLHTAQ